MPKLTGFASIPIPGPGALPWIGLQVNALRLVSDPIGQLLSLHREYGDVAAVARDNPALVCAFGAARNREVLSNAALFDNDDMFFFRVDPKSAIGKFQNALTLQTGERHKKHRRLMMPAFQKSAIDGYAEEIISLTAAALREWPVGEFADISSLMRVLVQRIAMQCFFGMDGTKGERSLGQLSAEVVDLLTSPLSVLLPYRIPGSPFSRLMDKSEELGARLGELIQEKRAQTNPGRDALALMVQARDQDNSSFSDDELLAEAITVFISGYDTQAQTLTWTLLLLAQHPKIFADVIDEITAVLGDAPPTVESIPRLVLVDRVLKESMRLMSAAPHFFIRVCQAEARLGSYTLPKAANVILSPFVTHRDPSVYAEPDRFKPERWETLSPTIYEYLPFGAGHRMCIGAAFATTALRLILPMILQKYRVSAAPGTSISRVVRSNILSPRGGLPMKISKQDRSFPAPASLRGDILELIRFS